MVNEIDKPLPTHFKKKQEDPYKIRNESKVKTDTTEIQRTVREYYEKSDANKLENLEEMDKLLET